MPTTGASKKQRGKKKTGRKKLTAAAIGRKLWAEFKKAAKPKTVGPAVIKQGVKLSGPAITQNAQLGNFPLALTLRCAKRCGIRARKYSGTSPKITVDAFTKAWNEVKANLGGIGGGAC